MIGNRIYRMYKHLYVHIDEYLEEIYSYIYHYNRQQVNQAKMV